jgi:hypothetical protein
MKITIVQAAQVFTSAAFLDWIINTVGATSEGAENVTTTTERLIDATTGPRDEEHPEMQGQAREIIAGLPEEFDGDITFFC